MRHIKPFTVMDDERGKLIEIMREGNWKQLNYLTIKKGDARGNHYHKKLIETFYVLKGQVKFEIKHIDSGEKQEFTLKQGQCVIIEPQEYHTLTAIEDVEMVSLYSELFDPKDLHTE